MCVCLHLSLSVWLGDWVRAWACKLPLYVLVGMLFSRPTEGGAERAHGRRSDSEPSLLEMALTNGTSRPALC